MSFLVAILVLLLLSLNLAYIFNQKFEYTLPLTIAAVSLSFYLLAFLNIRLVGIYFILAVTVGTSICSIYKRFIHKNKLLSSFRSAGLVGFLIILAVICFVAHGFVFGTWDEFSHWGLILKNLFQTNGFGNLAESTTLFKWYPQGVSLFLNYTTSFSKHFSEASALAGLLVMSCVQMLLIFIKVRCGDWKKIILLTTTVFIIPLIFFSGFYNTIYVDAVMALIFANILFFNYSYGRKDFFWSIYISLQFYLLINTKQIGIGLALIAFAAILFDLIAKHKTTQWRWSFDDIRHDLMYMTAPIVVSCFTYLSWKTYIKSHAIKENFAVPSLADIFHIIFGGYPAFRDTTVNNFIHYFFDIRQYGILPFSLFLWSLLVVIVLYIIHTRQKNLAIEHSFVFQAVIVIGAYIYAGAVLIMYLTSFSEYESTNLASIERYLGTYFLALLVLTVFIVIDYLIRKPLKANIGIAILLLALFCLAPMNSLADSTLLHDTTVTKAQNMRASYAVIKSFSGQLNAHKDKVYIISQNSSGLDYYVLRYEFTPVLTSNPNTWSLGKPYSVDDQWTDDLTAADWSSILKKYTYVFLYRVDARFIDDYGGLFEKPSDIQNDSFYKVQKSGNKVILDLVKI